MRPQASSVSGVQKPATLIAADDSLTNPQANKRRVDAGTTEDVRIQANAAGRIFVKPPTSLFSQLPKFVHRQLNSDSALCSTTTTNNNNNLNRNQFNTSSPNSPIAFGNGVERRMKLCHTKYVLLFSFVNLLKTMDISLSANRFAYKAMLDASIITKEKS